MTYAELARHLAEEERDDALGLAEVIDAWGATTDLTSNQVRSLVTLTDALVRKGRFGALAIVTDNDVAFGMARMYEILVDPFPVDIGVFREIGDALAWLDAARPDMPQGWSPPRRHVTSADTGCEFLFFDVLVEQRQVARLVDLDRRSPEGHLPG